MVAVRALLGLMLRAAAALVIVSLGVGPAPMAAAMSGHCAGHHPHGYGPTVRHSGVAVETVGAGAPPECPHCANADCPFLAPCAAGSIAVGAGRMPEIPGTGPVGAVIDGAADDARSLAPTPPTPPPLAIP